jgi:four helix bundle protein
MEYGVWRSREQLNSGKKWGKYGFSGEVVGSIIRAVRCPIQRKRKKNMSPVVTFQNLEAWKYAHALVMQVYQVIQKFPPEERYGLVSQMRRAAVSVPANVAEGFKRHGIRDKVRFYNLAEGSLEELKYYVILSRDLGYLANCSDLLTQADATGRLLYGLIKSTERRA